MELKYLVILSIFGVATAFTLPLPAEENGQGESSGDLQSSFPQSTSSEVDSSSNSPRDKRHLLFKKLKKHSSSDTVYVNRQYQGSNGYEYRPNREVHHHHHAYPAPPPQVVHEHTYQPYPAPSHEYHHYHGYEQQGYAGQGSSYYNGGYAAAGSYQQRPNYGDGGYAHYGAYGQGQQQQGPISSAPLASNNNAVDRGQGAAAVNNIAIIHARSGASNNLDLTDSESRILPSPLPAGVSEALSMMDN